MGSRDITDLNNQKLKHHHHYHVSIDDVILTLIFAEIMDQFGEGFPAKNT